MSNFVSGCSICFQVGSNSYTPTGYGSSGAVVLSATSGADVYTSMGLVVSGGITLNTNLPPDPVQAYNTFITQKRGAMTSGGSAQYGGYTQTFDSGGYISIANRCLMRLNDIEGDANAAVDGSGGYCNINMLPALGSWTEQHGSGSVLHKDPGCTNCDTWQDLMCLEMILYHAINKIAWRLMRERNNSYPEGDWKQYQELVDRWNTYVFAESYLCYATSIRESLAAIVGWSNPTCDTHGFLAYANIDFTGSTAQDDAYWAKYLLFYMGTAINSDDSDILDNNKATYNGQDPIPFIINTCNDATSGATVSASKIFLGTDANAKYTVLSAGVGAGSGSIKGFNALTATTYPLHLPANTSGAIISDIEELTQFNAGHWQVGVYVPALSSGGGYVKGLGYAAQNFATGFAVNLLSVDSSGYEVDTNNYNTYAVTPVWYDSLLSSRVEKPTQTLRTYAIKGITTT